MDKKPIQFYATKDLRSNISKIALRRGVTITHLLIEGCEYIVNKYKKYTGER